MERAAPMALIAAADVSGVKALLQEAGFDTVNAADAGRALELCVEMRLELVVADAVLPVMDGYALAKRIRRLRIPYLPGVIVMSLPFMARKCSLTGVAVVEKPIGMPELEEAIAAVRLDVRRPDLQICTAMDRALDALGIAAGPGRDYIADAAFLAAEDEGMLSRLTSALYPMVAARCGADAKSVERAMRRAIDRAWSTGNIEAQYGLFRNTIDAARGKPTCGEMIARLSEMLRRED